MGQANTARVADCCMKKKRLLLVDDDAAVRNSIRTVLEDAGYAVLTAASGHAADAYLENRVDLAILDLNLPRESGWDVFERLTTRFPYIPVIIITGLNNQYRMAQAAGVSALIEKPIDVTTLLSTVETSLCEPRDIRLRRMCGFQSDTRHFPHRSLVPQAATPGRTKRANQPEN